MTERHKQAITSGAALAVLAAALAACGIDQGGINSPPPPRQEAAVVVGPITGFGSVIVNGITLETSAAQIFADGKPIAESGLRVGQIIHAVATVTGSSTRAVSIEYDENIRGPVGQVDIAGQSLEVFGQTVLIDARTVFDLTAGNSLADLTAGQSIEISGFRVPGGELLASYVGSASANEPFEFTAPIVSVDTAAQGFELDGLSVDYSRVNLLDVPSGTPSPTLVVEVKGASLGPGGELIADQIRAVTGEPGLLDPSDTVIADLAAATSSPVATTTFRANFVGFVTAANPPASITLGGVRVTIDTATVIGGGANDLQPGRQVQVVGEVVGSGVVNADRIAIY